MADEERGIHHPFSQKKSVSALFVSLSFSLSLSFPKMHRIRTVVYPHTHLHQHSSYPPPHTYIDFTLLHTYTDFTLQQTAALEAKRAEASEGRQGSSCYPFQVSVVCVC